METSSCRHQLLMHRIYFLFLLPLLVGCQLFGGANTPTPGTKASLNEAPLLFNYLLHQKTDSLRQHLPGWLRRQGYNTRRVLVAHLGLHSGLPRMVLLNVADGSWADSGLVAHGSGPEVFAERPIYSNVPNSHCSSLGKYRIGTAYKGRFGTAFKLHGLEAGNSKAFERFVVLHAYDCVPDATVFPDYICNSQGCPMVSYGFLDRLKKVITASDKPMLLWIVN